MTPLALSITGAPLRLALFSLVGAVGAVLLIACSNVAGLLLAALLCTALLCADSPERTTAWTDGM